MEQLGVHCFLVNWEHLLDPGSQEFLNWSTNSYVKFVNARASVIKEILEVIFFG